MIGLVLRLDTGHPTKDLNVGQDSQQWTPCGFPLPNNGLHYDTCLPNNGVHPWEKGSGSGCV
jgi:hypothetical protein